MEALSQKLDAAITAQAAFIRDLTFEKLDARTVRQAKLLLLDALGCIAGGVSDYDASAFPDGDYPVVGGKKSDKAGALFLNGTAMVSRELDEGNQFSAGHPSCHIFPAFLSELQGKTLGGREAIAAIAAAYEVSCRWGCSVKLPLSMHVHGTMQNAGAAAVSCKLNGCDAETTRQAILLANSLPQATGWLSATEGDRVRNAYIGLSGNIGANAFRLVNAGIRSSFKTAASVWADVLHAQIDPEGLTKGLGSLFYINMNYFKMHSACRFTHCFLDIARQFVEEGLDRRTIEKIEVSTYRSAARLDAQRVNNDFALRFSIPVTLALMFVFGEYSPAVISDENANAPEVLALAAKIEVKEDPAFTALLPDIRRNKMVVRTTDSRVFERETDVTKGDYLDPYSEEELLAKFRRQAAAVYAPAQIAAIEDFVLTLDSRDNAADLLELL